MFKASEIVWLEPYRTALAEHISQEKLEDVIQRWQEPHRRFHTLDHLRSILLRISPAATAKVLAAVYHDAIYDIPAQTRTNEERSSELLLDHVRDPHASAVDQACRIVVSTSKFSHKSDPDEEEFFLLDCQVLLSDDQGLLAYEKRIRGEFGIYPNPVYREHRAHFLSEASKVFPENAPALLRLREWVLANYP